MRLDPITLTADCGQGEDSSYAVLQKSEDAIKILIPLRKQRAENFCRLYELGLLAAPISQPVKPDDHSDLVPLLPIPNRTVKRVSADDSADSRVKVGHRQAIYPAAPTIPSMVGVLLCKRHFAINSRARVPIESTSKSCNQPAA